MDILHRNATGKADQNLTETQPMNREKKQKIMRSVMRTFAAKEAQVKEMLMAIEGAGAEKPKNRGQWVSRMMNQLRTNDGFRSQFAGIVLSNSNRQSRQKLEQVKKQSGSGGIDKATKRPADNFPVNNLPKKGMSNFLGAIDPIQQLSNDIKDAANSTSDAEALQIGEQAKTENTLKKVVIFSVLAIIIFKVIK